MPYYFFRLDADTTHRFYEPDFSHKYSDPQIKAFDWMRWEKGIQRQMFGDISVEL
jgi:hypothetical protein